MSSHMPGIFLDVRDQLNKPCGTNVQIHIHGYNLAPSLLKSLFTLAGKLSRAVGITPSPEVGTGGGLMQTEMIMWV